LQEESLFATKPISRSGKPLDSYQRLAIVSTFSRSTVWLVFICSFVLSFAAFGTRTPTALCWLTAADTLFLVITRPGVTFLKRAAKTIIWQAGIISGLYWLRFGSYAGIVPGLVISWQLALAFLPGMVFVKIVPGAGIVGMFSAILPYRMAFIMATCLNFLPLLLTEIKSIQEGQVLRGAKILPKDLLNPLNWLDVVHCLVVPVMIQTMNLSAQIALAAKARDFGIAGQRSFWPGEKMGEGNCFKDKGTTK
jgi:energy-coupling factor transporter transmembrane protein EcfT